MSVVHLNEHRKGCEVEFSPIIKKKKRKGWMALPKGTRRRISLSVIFSIMVLLFILAVQGINSSREREISGYSHIEVMVGEEQTAWSLQEKLLPGEHIGELLFYAEKVNGKSLGNLVPGESIILFSRGN